MKQIPCGLHQSRAIVDGNAERAGEQGKIRAKIDLSTLEIAKQRGDGRFGENLDSFVWITQKAFEIFGAISSR
jgi:hypothetical protein